jgi:cell division septation protein DedD
MATAAADAASSQPQAATGTAAAAARKVQDTTKDTTRAKQSDAGTNAASGNANAANAGAASSFSVKLASSTTERDARLTLSQLRKQFPGLLEAGSVHQEDLGSAGVFYRVRVGGLTHDAADKICAQLKAAGKACTPTGG